jgi:hypothetical protein
LKRQKHNNKVILLEGCNYSEVGISLLGPSVLPLKPARGIHSAGNPGPFNDSAWHMKTTTMKWTQKQNDAGPCTQCLPLVRKAIAL